MVLAGGGAQGPRRWRTAPSCGGAAVRWRRRPPRAGVVLSCSIRGSQHSASPRRRPSISPGTAAGQGSKRAKNASVNIRVTSSDNLVVESGSDDLPDDPDDQDEMINKRLQQFADRARSPDKASTEEVEATSGGEHRLTSPDFRGNICSLSTRLSPNHVLADMTAAATAKEFAERVGVGLGRNIAVLDEMRQWMVGSCADMVEVGKYFDVNGTLRHLEEARSSFVKAEAERCQLADRLAVEEKRRVEAEARHAETKEALQREKSERMTDRKKHKGIMGKLLRALDGVGKKLPSSPSRVSRSSQ